MCGDIVAALRRPSPEALFAQGQGQGSGLVLLPVHDGGNPLLILHQHRQFAVPEAQHAAVVDVGRAWD